MGLLWTFSTAPTFRSRNLSRSSSGFSRTTSLAPLILKRRARRAASPARAAVLSRSRSASPRGPASSTCRSCRRQTGPLVGAVMERRHTPLSVWALGGSSGCQPDAGHVGGAVSAAARSTRYGSRLRHLHKLRAGMVRPDQDRDRRPDRRACRGGRSRCWRPGLVAKGEVYTTTTLVTGCRRGSSPGAGHGAGQAEGWSLMPVASLAVHC